MIKCTRCGRLRRDKFIVMRKSRYNNKIRARCSARSVCASIARRRQAKASGKSEQ